MEEEDQMCTFARKKREGKSLWNRKPAMASYIVNFLSVPLLDPYSMYIHQ